MSTYRCSQCGCRIEVAEGTKIGTCPACQAVFVLPNQFAQKENLYLLASDARHSGNYGFHVFFHDIKPPLTINILYAVYKNILYMSTK